MSPQCVHQEMGLAGRLGKPVASARPQNNLARPVKAHPIAGRDVDRFDPIPGSQYDPYLFPFVVKKLRTPSVLRWLAILPYEEALGAANRW